MEYRRLGAAGPNVSVIGMGTWAIGGLTPGATSYGPMDDDTSRDAIVASLEAGVTFFDTANVYGDGHSEELLGETLRPFRHTVVIATKCGMQSLAGGKDFSPRAVMQSVHSSLHRLRTDYVDLLQLHDPPIALAADDALRRVLTDMVAAGTVRALGVSIKSPADGLAFLDGCWQSVQCNLNLMDVRAIECGLVSKAAAAGVGIIARTPLAFGFLSERFGDEPPTFHHSDHRSRWAPRQIEAWLSARRVFEPVAAASGRSLPQLALAFCKDMPGVTATIPGSTTRQESLENAFVGSLPPLEPSLMSELVETSKGQRFFLR